MTRRHRRFIAWLGIVGLAFAQIAVTAHACMIRVDRVDLAVAPAPHHGHCGGPAAPAPFAPHANACELACSDGAPTAAAPDVPPAAVASLPIAVAPSAGAVGMRACGRSLLAANSAAPPISLAFCRLLI